MNADKPKRNKKRTKVTLAWCSNKTFKASGWAWPAAQIRGVPASHCESTSTPLESKYFSNSTFPENKNNKYWCKNLIQTAKWIQRKKNICFNFISYYAMQIVWKNPCSKNHAPDAPNLLACPLKEIAKDKNTYSCRMMQSCCA